MDGVHLKVLPDAYHQVQRFTDLGAFLLIQFCFHLFHPAVAFLDPLFDQFTPLLCEIEQLGAPVAWVFLTHDIAALNELVYELACSGRRDLEPFADLRHAACAAMIHLHHHAELRHRKPCRSGKTPPSTHGTVHKNIHPRSNGPIKLGLFYHS